MKCPGCEVELTMAERQGIEIDYCPQCRGVWLDRGELDKIIERSTDGVSATTAPAWRGQEYEKHKHKHDDGDGDEYYRKRRKKSFLSELFD